MDQEIVIVANTDTVNPCAVYVIVDNTLNNEVINSTFFTAINSSRKLQARSRSWPQAQLRFRKRTAALARVR